MLRHLHQPTIESPVLHPQDPARRDTTNTRVTLCAMRHQPDHRIEANRLLPTLVVPQVPEILSYPPARVMDHRGLPHTVSRLRLAAAASLVLQPVDPHRRSPPALAIVTVIVLPPSMPLPLNFVGAIPLSPHVEAAGPTVVVYQLAGCSPRSVATTPAQLLTPAHNASTAVLQHTLPVSRLLLKVGKRCQL